MINFKKISMNQNGFRGAEIHYLEPNDKGINELTKKYPRNPVHLGLEKLFKDLRVHLLWVCDVINDSMDINEQAQKITETSVHTIELDGEHIVVSGEKYVLTDKYIDLKTCKIQEGDGYEHYEELKRIVEEICAETEQYMSGSKKVDEKELLLRYAEVKHRTDITEESLKGLTQEQLVEMSLKILEKGVGAMVMMPQDIDVNSEEMMGAIEEIKEGFAMADDASEPEIDEVPIINEEEEEQF